MWFKQRFPHQLLAAIFLYVTLLAGCKESTTTAPSPSDHAVQTNTGNQSTARNGPLPTRPELRQHIERVSFDASERLHDFYRDDEALITAVREVDGMVSVGFKDPADGRLVDVGYVPAVTRSQAVGWREALTAQGAQINLTFRNTATVAARIDPDDAPRIRDLPFVSYLTPVGKPGHLAVVRRSGGPTGVPAPRMRQIETPPQDTTWGLHKAHVPEAWQYVPTRGEGVYITILDSGIDSIHAWNAYGDALAWGRTNFDCLWANIGNPPPFSSCYDDVVDISGQYVGHGTLVHSVAVGRNNAYGYVGTAHGVVGTAMVKVCARTGECRHEWLQQGLDFAIDNSASYPRQIVNMSLSLEENNDATHEMITRARDHGIVLIAAAGNLPPPLGGSGNIRYPAKYSEVLAVSGTLEDDSFARMRSPTICHFADSVGSKFGFEVFIAAPFWAWGMRGDGTYGTDCGTSFAAPLVSGVAALIWSKNPTQGRAFVENALANATVDLGGPIYYFGNGRVDVCAYLDCTPPPPFSVYIDGPDVVHPMASCTWFAAPSGGTPPYHSYQWSGVLSGSSSSVSGSIFTSGTLYLSVKDSSSPQQTKYVQKNITVDWNAPPFCN